MSPSIAMSGKKYSKKADPEAVVGGPMVRTGISLGGMVSRFSQTASGKGAGERSQLIKNIVSGESFWQLLTINFTVRIRYCQSRVERQGQMPIQSV
jgi:hypothetical protein